MILLLLACARAPSPCADGMVLIPVPAGSPPTCIDAWEVEVTGTVGAPGALARSRPGVLPTVGIAWTDAAAACAATPVIDPRTGAVVGTKHLATATEWQDAGDGLAGPGGTRYPWGDTADPGRCALPPAAGPSPGDALSLTGAHPDCVSAAGAYDLLGNAWEWVDSGARVDLARFIAGAVGLSADGDPLRVTNPVHLRGYQITVPNLPGTLGVGDDAALVFQPRHPMATAGRGYLVHETGRTLDERLAPVALVPDGSGRVVVHLLRELDGAPIPEKRGGAWYAGGDADLATTSWQHLPDFAGTIGFRCAGPALP